jgi:transcriptional regulator with PAS, ATPase and Fis domain
LVKTHDIVEIDNDYKEHGLMEQIPESTNVAKLLHNFLLEHPEQDGLNQKQAMLQLAQLLDAILNNPFEKIVITDREGNIIFMNDAYARMISAEQHEVVGKKALLVLGKETRMHIVGKTLKPELHALFRTANINAVARRYPLISGDNVLGVMGKDLFDNLYDLSEVARQASELHRLYNGRDRSKKEGSNRTKYGLNDIISRDKGIIKIKELIRTAARTASTILLQGETGVGKELFAHAIHRESNRVHGPFVSVNCGAIPETLLETELFGYEEGAFTGARKGGKPGKFEMADGGTIFLDEIGEIPLNSQVKILRVLQEKEIQRVGDTKTIPVDIRVIASTNRNLWQLCEEKKFRLDLFYRLSVVPVTIPPLRDRLGDIPLLVKHFIDKFNSAFGLSVQGVDAKELKRFSRYYWPGNVRELEAVIEGSMNRVVKGTKTLSEFPTLTKQKDSDIQTDNLSLKDNLDILEAKLIATVLDRYQWDMDRTAAALEISPASLYRKVKKHNLK